MSRSTFAGPRADAALECAPGSRQYFLKKQLWTRPRNHAGVTAKRYLRTPALRGSRPAGFIHRNAHERVTNRSAVTFYSTPFVAGPFPRRVSHFRCGPVSSLPSALRAASIARRSPRRDAADRGRTRVWRLPSNGLPWRDIGRGSTSSCAQQRLRFSTLEQNPAEKGQ